MSADERFEQAYAGQRDKIEKERNRPRTEFEKDLLYYAMYHKADYDALVQRLMLSVLLDLRDQNERIIALLEDGAISDEVRKQKMRIIALQAITDVQKRDAYGS